MRVLLILILFSLSAYSQAPLQSLTFPSYNSKDFSGNELSDKKAIVFIFLMPDCPFCQKYTKALNDLNKKYSSKNIVFEGVITGDLYTEKEVKDYIKDYRLSFPILYDKYKKLSTYYKMGISPSVVVSDNKGKVIYKGLIDNWPVSPGKTRQIITENYLIDVLNAITTNKPVNLKNTEAVGCIIEEIFSVTYFFYFF